MIEAVQDGSTLTVRISGKFNFSCFREFNEAVSRSGTSAFVVDLSAVEYMDSSALGMLLLLRDKAGKEQEKVSIVAGKGQPRDVLKLANFHQLFRMV